MDDKGTGRTILLLLVIMIVASAAARAQNSPGGMGQQPQPGQQPGQQPGMQPGNPNYPGMNTPGNGPSPTDQAFIRSVMESDVAEVQLGQLALQKSQSEDVKDFGQKMVDIRTQLNSQLVQLAKHLDVSQPKGPSKKDKELLAKLETLSGPQFDEEYIRAVVKAHEKDVKNFKSAAESAQDPNVLQTAKMDAPVLEQHLQAIQQIAQAHNINTEESSKK